MRYFFIFVFLKSITLLAVTDFTQGTENYQLAKQGIAPKTIGSTEKATTSPIATSTVKKSTTSPRKTSTVKKSATSPRKTSTVKKSAIYTDITEIISVTGQGVQPDIVQSPAQGFALAKRAAISDAYRQLAEKIKGIKISGNDTIKNMMIKRSVVRTKVNALVSNATIVETTFKDGLCEVEMEIRFNHKVFR